MLVDIHFLKQMRNETRGKIFLLDVKTQSLRTD